MKKEVCISTMSILKTENFNAVDKNKKYGLTAREKEVLKLLIKGYYNKEIAKILNVTTETAKSHVSSILSKLKARNRIKAAVIAIKEELVD